MPDNSADYGSRQFALPPELVGLNTLFQQGNAAIIGNVGPLLQPVSRADFATQSVPLPARLFSHNDQQSTWVSSAPEGAQFGWGGKFLDSVLAAGANTSLPVFSTIATVPSNTLFLTGRTVAAYQITVQGAPQIDLLEFFSAAEVPLIYQQLRAHFSGAYHTGSNLLERDLAVAATNSLQANEQYNQARANAQPLTTAFPANRLGAQLKAVAETISMRDLLMADRQIFLVGIGGFDTHSDQATTLPQLLAQLDSAVLAFYQSLEELNAAADVTLFTASDFGRTLVVNGDGTDHGWGAHHFVVGGAVQGRQLYGHIPTATVDHDQDAGGGRLIPTVAVEQFAQPLGRWFGLNDTELASALPNLANFSDPTLGFMG